MKGRCVFKHGNGKYLLKKGDLIYFDGGYYHSVIALEPFEFFGINFIKK